jgi:F-box protein 9
MQLDSRVHETYKNKHFPFSSFQASKIKSQEINPSGALVTVPNTAHRSLDGLSASLSSLVQDFSALSILGEEPPTDLSPPPPCPISTLPEEILVEILLDLAVQDVASFVRLAQTCKRLAYLVLTEERVWKRVAEGPEFGFGAMHYYWACKVNGKPLGDDEGGNLLSSTDTDAPEPVSCLTALLVPQAYPNYRALFRSRPRIRFNGCYISTVNYTRPGASSPTSISWNSPIHIVTYYRYLRFFRNGTCISLLTVAEPAEVIPYLVHEHMHTHHSGNLPTAVMKDALAGRWRLSGMAPPSAGAHSPHDSGTLERAVGSEAEGTLHIETAGVTPKYTYKMAFLLGSAGRAARNNKLAWKGYWSYNRLADDWAEFGLKNDRPFYFSRVKSYGDGYVK